MVKYVLFSDPLRQEEIETFYKACQMHRDQYRGYPKSHHLVEFFIEPDYKWQCPSEMTQVYLRYPAFHVKYKQPVTWPVTLDRTSGMPTLPDRTLAGRYNKQPCKRFTR
ncbi:hypothetical protein PYW07_005719 [Mythimna separata]|uniref:Uncharacterized protein n=1 Tax=Mythimna separata TaxID=271217 RepID=A0AAD7YJ98_MYTSE|nr:hypothetical protein PYW07_005719 [Mythimna separata]